MRSTRRSPICWLREVRERPTWGVPRRQARSATPSSSKSKMRPRAGREQPAAELDAMQRIFLDNNSTTRPLPEVIAAVSAHSAASFANPGSRHAEGRVARRALEEARDRIARLLGARPGEVIFTSGGTESINLAILGLAPELPGTV